MLAALHPATPACVNARSEYVALLVPTTSVLLMNRRRVALLVTVVGALVRPVLAQQDPTSSTSAAQAPSSAPRSFESRAQLEAQARVAESRKRTSEAWLLRSRLERGDFQEGDRIVVVLDGGQMVLDTLQVRSGRVLNFPRMGELQLTGVLRSELTDTIRHHLARYLQNPVVRATPLLPLAVLGSVTRPGFYDAPADIVLRDMIMKAGGPTNTADLNKVEIRRGGEVIWKPEDVRVALTDGLSLDGLHLRAGDEIFVPERRRLQVANVTTILTAAVAAALGIMQLTR
jgi:protein involved in polysaccharide export with SLBB domain